MRAKLARRRRRLVMPVAAAVTALASTALIGAPVDAVQANIIEVTSDVRVSDGPTVAVTPSGTAIALWTERTWDVMAAMRLAGDPDWSEPTRVTRNGFYATIATHGSDGATIGWQSLGGTEDNIASIKTRTLDAQGDWGPAERVTRWERKGGVTVALTIAANARGDMLAAWTRGQKVRAAYRVAGSTWGEEFVFPDLDAYSLDAVANVSRSGAADLLFPAQRAGRLSTLRAYHRDATGSWSGQTVARYATGLHFPGSTFDAAINRRGDIAAAWMRRDAGEPWRLFVRLQPAASSFGTREFVSAAARNPAVAVDGSGGAGVAFHARRGTDTVTAFEYRFPAGGGSEEVEIARSATSELRYPQIGLETNASGNFLVHTQGVHSTSSGSIATDHRLVHCTPSLCGDDQRVTGPRGYRAISYGVQPSGEADVAWGFGCATEECIPTGVRAMRMTVI